MRAPKGNALKLRAIVATMQDYHKAFHALGMTIVMVDARGRRTRFNRRNLERVAGSKMQHVLRKLAP